MPSALLIKVVKDKKKHDKKSREDLQYEFIINELTSVQMNSYSVQFNSHNKKDLIHNKNDYLCLTNLQFRICISCETKTKIIL